MSVWLYTLISIFLVSLISLIGVFFLSLKTEILRKISLFLISFAVGGLFGDAFIHLLPESFEKLGANLKTSLLIVLGVLIFFSLEKFLRWRHCHITDSPSHVHPVVTMNFIGDAIHNLIDGMLIGASFLVSIPLGVSTSLAIILHEIPQEIGDFSIFIHGGLAVKKALLFNFLSALAGFLGALTSLFIGARVEGYALALLPITAGGFLYIAGSDLIPELQHDVKIKTSLGQLVSIILGVGIMALLVLLR